MSTIMIIQENEQDYKTVEALIEAAFLNAQHTDHQEHHLVGRLRQSDAFIKELSLVAKLNDEIVGHALLTKIKIDNGRDVYDSLALAPVSVLPTYQNQKIGSQLIETGIQLAKTLGYDSIIVLGHEQYYPRFGFKKASSYDIKAPFEVPDEAFMAMELNENSLNNVNGTVIYSSAFFE